MFGSKLLHIRKLISSALFACLENGTAERILVGSKLLFLSELLSFSLYAYLEYAATEKVDCRQNARKNY